MQIRQDEDELFLVGGICFCIPVSYVYHTIQHRTSNKGLPPLLPSETTV